MDAISEGAPPKTLGRPITVSGSVFDLMLELTCVQMAVEVDDGYRSVGAIDRAEQWKGDGMVTSQCDQTW